MKYPIALLIGAVFFAQSLRAAIYTNSPDADAYVRAVTPASNFGSAGALAVSGTNAVNGSGVANGVFDSFIRFNTAAMVANFDTVYGSNNWVINGAALQVTEIGAPANSVFNRGVGTLQIRWIANDGWTEGAGTPTAATTNGISFNTESTLLNANADVSLGVFTNAGVDGALNFSLALPTAFVSDVRAGGEVSFYLTALDAKIGLTVDSRNFGTASARPCLNISAVSRPVLAGASVTGANIVLAGANGVTNQTYLALASTSLALPLSQWAIISTNVVNVNGNFTITLTNAAAGPQRFFMLQTK